MLVDCHVNIWNDEHLLSTFHEQMARIRPGGMTLEADAATLAAEMRSVDRAIVFALRYGDSAGVESDDATTAACVRAHPDKFVGFAYADPRRPDCMELLRHAIENLGLKGVKYGPIYNGVPLDDPRMTPIYDYCVRNDLPLTMHMGTTFGRNTPLELGRAMHVDPVARRWPDLKMVLAHMGHPWYEECIVVVRKHPNVFAEVSALFYRPWQFWNILITAQEYLVIDKIFWGTDFPFARVDESINGLRNVNRVIEGTALPRVSEATVKQILTSNPFAHWWHEPAKWPEGGARR
jgi:predicted TIM-barrel fold metal-dependent hydrolase